MCKVWIGVIGIVFLMVFSSSAFAVVDLGAKGESCGAMTCTVASAVLKSDLPDRLVYEFTGQCGYPYASGVAACPPSVQVMANGIWYKHTKIAYEKIFSSLGKTSSVTVHSETSSLCPKGNPWLNASFSCSVISGITEPGILYPRSAFLLNNAQRNALANAKSSGSLYTAPTAPVIVLPAQNTTFVVTPALVKLEIKHNPNYGLNYEFQWKPFTKPNSPPGIFIPKKMTPSNVKTASGVTTAEVKIDTRGYWRLRAQSVIPGAPWSDWTAFTVENKSVSVEFMTIKEKGK